MVLSQTFTISTIFSSGNLFGVTLGITEVLFVSASS